MTLLIKQLTKCSDIINSVNRQLTGEEDERLDIYDCDHLQLVSGLLGEIASEGGAVDNPYVPEEPDGDGDPHMDMSHDPYQLP